MVCVKRITSLTYYDLLGGPTRLFSIRAHPRLRQSRESSNGQNRMLHWGDKLLRRKRLNRETEPSVNQAHLHRLVESSSTESGSFFRFEHQRDRL